MASPNGGGSAKHAYIARITNRAKHLPVDLTRVTNALDKALDTAEALLDDDDKLLRLKAIHALSQTSAALMKVLEIGEQEARLAAVEEALLAEEAS